MFLSFLMKVLLYHAPWKCVIIDWSILFDPKTTKVYFAKNNIRVEKRRNLEDQSQAELLQNNSQSFKNAYGLRKFRFPSFHTMAIVLRWCVLRNGNLYVMVFGHFSTGMFEVRTPPGFISSGLKSFRKFSICFEK